MFTNIQIICLFITVIIFIYSIINRICNTIENINKMNCISCIAMNMSSQELNEFIDNINNDIKYIEEEE